jgi:hypothetical protein
LNRVVVWEGGGGGSGPHGVLRIFFTSLGIFVRARVLVVVLRGWVIWFKPGLIFPAKFGMVPDL